jgi:hypothetical protein
MSNKILLFIHNSLAHFTFLGCLSVLDKEIVPESTALTASAQYRKSLALGLFYKVSNH